MSSFNYIRLYGSDNGLKNFNKIKISSKTFYEYYLLSDLEHLIYKHSVNKDDRFYTWDFYEYINTDGTINFIRSMHD